MPDQKANSLQDEAADLAALERFIVDNDELLELESRVGRFNIFDALGIARTEIRHSNFLSFILDPAESHGQGQLFLRAILMDLLKEAHRKLTSRPLSPIDLDGTDLRGVQIRREWEHMDLVIACEEPKFAVVIENKVDSQEHSDQLARYRETWERHNQDTPTLFVYLTPEGDNASEDDWLSYSYRDIHRVFSRIRKTYANAIGPDVLAFLDHYLSLIGARFMNDEEITKLCQQIYKNHRRAVELIYEQGRPDSGVLAVVNSVIESDSRWLLVYRTRAYIDFVPHGWLKSFPPVGLDYKKHPQCWCVLRFALYEGQLDFYVQVGRMEDLKKRRAIVELLVKEGSQFGFKHSGYKIKDNFTRISGRERVLRWKAEDEPKPEAVRAAVEKKLSELYPKLDGVPSLLKPLFDPSAEVPQP